MAGEVLDVRIYTASSTEAKLYIRGQRVKSQLTGSAKIYAKPGFNLGPQDNIAWESGRRARVFEVQGRMRGLDRAKVVVEVRRIIDAVKRWYNVGTVSFDWRSKTWAIAFDELTVREVGGAEPMVDVILKFSEARTWTL